MTGLTTFLHTQSHLDTSDISGLTVLTAGTRSAGRSRATTKTRATTKSGDTWMDWDSDKTDNNNEFTFDGGGSDLEGSSMVDTENIELVPFELGEEDVITDFDLSSHVPDSEDSGDEQTSLISTGYTDVPSSATASNKSTNKSTKGKRGRRHNAKRFSSRRLSRRSQMTMTGTDMSVMSSYDGRRGRCLCFFLNFIYYIFIFYFYFYFYFYIYLSTSHILRSSLRTPRHLRWLW